jgi:hypothetical protein
LLSTTLLTTSKLSERRFTGWSAPEDNQRSHSDAIFRIAALGLTVRQLPRNRKGRLGEAALERLLPDPEGGVMAYRIAGTYVLSCNCRQVCPCSFDVAPTAPDGICHVAVVFRVDQGSLDDVDLTGANYALYFDIRNKLSAGGWKLGLVVDEAASEEQASALERIIRGSEGGPFGDLAGLMGEFLGTKRARVTVSDGEAPKGSVEGMTEIEFEGYVDHDGNPTTVKNAMFGFVPEYKIGRGKGRSSGFGLDYESEFGESADYEFAS